MDNDELLLKIISLTKTGHIKWKNTNSQGLLWFNADYKDSHLYLQNGWLSINTTFNIQNNLLLADLWKIVSDEYKKQNAREIENEKNYNIAVVKKAFDL